MARIRTIKPEFFTSEQLVECSTNARLLFVGIWVFSDDKGRHTLSYQRLKMEVFPGDPFTVDQVTDWFHELWRVGLVTVYESGPGLRYFVVNGWSHQKIDRPQPPKHPDPMACKIVEYDETDRRPFDDRSTNDRRTFATEGKGREGKGSNTPPPPPAHACEEPIQQPEPSPPAQLRTWKYPLNSSPALCAAIDRWQACRIEAVGRPDGDGVIEAMVLEARRKKWTDEQIDASVTFSIAKKGRSWYDPANDFDVPRTTPAAAARRQRGAPPAEQPF